MTKKEAAADTIRFAINSGLAEVADKTGLYAGEAAAAAVEAIFDELTSPALVWALEAWMVTE